METFSRTDMAWLELGDSAPRAMERANLDATTMMGVTRDYDAFLAQLDGEWPPVKIQHYLLAQKRRQYATCKARLNQLEAENHDARIRGISYRDRKPLTYKIHAGAAALQHIEQEGIHIKRTAYSVHTLVEPMDVPSIQENGFEWYLKRLSTLTLALSPVKVYT